MYHLEGSKFELNPTLFVAHSIFIFIFSLDNLFQSDSWNCTFKYKQAAVILLKLVFLTRKTISINEPPQRIFRIPYRHYTYTLINVDYV